MILLPGHYYILFIHTFVLLKFEFVFLLLIFFGALVHDMASCPRWGHGERWFVRQDCFSPAQEAEHTPSIKAYRNGLQAPGPAVCRLACWGFR